MTPAFILVRDAEAHKQAFASPAAYLARAERGLAAGSPWPCDFGPDLSRGFRALKVWFTLKVLGTERLGAAISRCCALARYLEGRINATPELELMAPVELNIVCFRYRAADSGERGDCHPVAGVGRGGAVYDTDWRPHGDSRGNREPPHRTRGDGRAG